MGVLSYNSRTVKLTDQLSTEYVQKFVGVFAKLRKTAISCVISVCPSVPPHATTRLLPERFLRNLMLRIFGNSVERLHG